MGKYNLQRKNVISWDAVFMATTYLFSERSKDPNTQVGACIVDRNNRIISIGYNGTPNGWDDSDFPWAREGEELEKKYPYVVHAERNAILNYRGDNNIFQDAKIYVSHFPCHDCAKEIVQVGIKEVIYNNDKYAYTDSIKASKITLQNCGVVYREITDEVREEIQKLFQGKGKTLIR
ncbi:MAG: cytidine/deoxycytidylate deaminase family protein [Bacilli bacterium]|jgi:dCMP deaminase|nr:cytidine/deoxycytidylate deaminase family protein [Bacilli bacterium]